MTVRTVPPTLLRAALVATGITLAMPAGALDAPKQSAPATYDFPALTFPQNRITLIEAVRLTLQHDPALKLSEQQAISSRGAAQTESGRFDPLLKGNASFSLTRSALTKSQIKTEQEKRDLIQTKINNAVSAQSQATTYISELTQLAQNPTTYRLPQNDANLVQVQSQVDLLNALIASTTDATAKAAYLRLRNEYIARALKGSIDGKQGAIDEQARQQQKLADLGEIPKDNQQTTSKFDLSLLFPYRDGVTLGLFGNGSWERDRFLGKDKDKDLGGKGSEDVYNLSVGFSVDAALLRGRGSEATGAAEKAANINWEASTLAYKHAASTSVLTTIAAYWNLVAAQEQLEISKRSLELQTKRVEVTKALIAGDEIPRAELSRILASLASDQSQVFSSERAVNEGRVNLARAMGLGVVEEANAPLAADPFPAVPDRVSLLSVKPSDLIATAVDRRFDRQSAQKLRESGGVLLVAARTDLRPKLDFHGQISAGTVGETSLASTANGWSAPSFTLSLAFEKPIGNNVARGVLLQREASLNQQTISASDLERVIKANVVQIYRSLQETADQVERSKEASSYYQKTVEAENEKFRNGQSTLIDTITTQQQGTSAFFGYAAARQQWATLLAQLRFETGTLVAESGGQNVVRQEDLLTVPRPAPVK